MVAGMIYKYCPPTNHSLENLKARQLYARHYARFNDPFEFWSRIIEGVPTVAEEDRIRAALAAWGFPGRAHVDDQQEYFDSLDGISPAFRAMYDYTRIVCFGSDRSNLLMWSHYTDGLRGFCVGFDERKLVKDSKNDAYITKVEYLREPPLVDAFIYSVASDQYDYHMTCIDDRPRNETYIGSDPISDYDYRECADEAMLLMKQIWMHAFAAKPIEWSYEQELRMLIRTDDRGDKPILHSYATDAVREIIVGDRMPTDFRDGLLQVIAEFEHIDLFQTVQSAQSYSLGIERITDIK